MTSRTRPSGSKEAILDAAADLIRTHGVVGTSIADVIARSRTSAGAIYHHFGNKHGVVLAVAQRSLAKSLASAMREPGVDPVSPAALFTAATAHVAREQGTAELMVQVWSGAVADPDLKNYLKGEIAGLHTAVALVIGRWCRERGLESEAHPLAETIAGLVVGFAVQRAMFDGFDEAGYVAMGARLLDAVAAR